MTQENLHSTTEHQGLLGARLHRLKAMTWQDVRQYLKRMERHPRTKSFKRALDYTVTMATSSHYEGENPALRAAYAPLRTSLRVMIILFVVIFIFGAFVPIKSAAVSNGTIVVSSYKKTIQHLEGGIVKKILVADGDTVKQGQTLIELNDITPKSNRNLAKTELLAARLSEARINALKTDAPTFTIPEEIAEEARDNKALAEMIANQQDLFSTEGKSQQSKLGTLQQRIAQANEEIIGYEAQVESSNQQLRLIVEEIEPMDRLVAKGYASRPQLLALQRKQQELEGNKGQLLASIAKAKQSIAETQLQIDTIKSEFGRQISDEQSDVHERIASYDEKLRASSDIMQRTIITAPSDGIVTGLKPHTIGAVIAPGEAIMDIVPQNEAMIIEAHVQPADIDVVAPGLPAKISFSAYKTRSMPRITGHVTYVSADATSLEQAGQSVSFYKSRVEVDRRELEQLATKVKLYPGMPVEVFIETGSRSFLGYMLAPISSSLRRAFKED